MTWDREIAPIVQARCASCHAPGGKGPMSLTTYEEVRPWARAIKEEVLARRMPKWHVVRGYGDFTNDRSLAPFEIGLIAAWVDGGAPLSAKAGAGKLAAPQADATRTAPVAPPPVRAVTLPCSTRTLPTGRLLALRPILRKGDSLRLTMTTVDGIEQPMLWIRDADPAFVETYWLRNPVAITRGTTVAAEFSGPCTLTSLFAARTAR